MIKFEKIPSGILSKLSVVKTLLAQDDNVVFAFLFGGLAKGTASPLSDVDIAVYLKSVDNLSGYKLDLFDRLANILGTSEIDLVILNNAPTSLVGRILTGKQIMIDKEPFRRHIFESVSLREFFDFRVKENNIFYLRYGIGR